MDMINSYVEEISEKELKEVLQKPISIVNFFAEWKMSCLMMSPIIDEIAEKFNGKIKFAKIDISENRKISEKFNINSLPTIILFKEGKEACRLCGSLTQEQIEEKVRGYAN